MLRRGWVNALRSGFLGGITPVRRAIVWSSRYEYLYRIELDEEAAIIGLLTEMTSSCERSGASQSAVYNDPLTLH
jgi:hypothetical protein